MLSEKIYYRFLIGKYQFDVTKCIPVSYMPPKPAKGYTCSLLSYEFVRPEPIRQQHVIIESNFTKGLPKKLYNLSAERVSYGVVKGIQLEVTDGFLTKLAGRQKIAWEPFVCKIEKRLYNKRIKKWFLVLNDNKNSFRVGIATQCFDLFEKNIIKKSDLLYVNIYTATIMRPKKPKFIILIDFHKIVQ
jgi:hypothetical protein